MELNMNRVQKLQLEQSEKRSALGVLLDAETPDSEGIGKLSAELRSLETTMQAAILAEGEPLEKRNDPVETSETAEEREMGSLRGRVETADYIRAAISQRSVEGAAREFNQALGMDETRFPLELLDLETRAARDGDSNANQGTWLDRVMDGTAAERIGITFTPVGAGVASYPVMSAGGEPIQRGRTQAVTESTYTVAVTELKPSRAAVHGVYSIEDNARLPGLADAIMRDMARAMTERIDKKIFVGDSGANENDADITGLTTAGISEATLTQAQKVKADKTLEEFVSYIDGAHAMGLGDVRVVVAEGANKLWYGTIHNSVVENETIAQFLTRSGLTWTVRGGIETNTANGDFGAFAGLARGLEGAARACVWSGADLIVDRYTGAAKGEVQLTLNYLWNFAIPRVANFKRLKYVA